MEILSRESNIDRNKLISLIIALDRKNKDLF